VSLAPLFPTTTVLIATAILVASVARNGRPGKTVKSSAGIETYVRILRIGSRRLPEQTRLLVRFAPLNSPRTAIEVTETDSPHPLRIIAADVQSVRVWLGGHAVIGAGLVPDVGATQNLRPLFRPVASWEMELVTWAGDVLRCYGTEPAELDLARLRRLVAAHQCASAVTSARAETQVDPYALLGSAR
jgi:hypothetical protein